MLCVIVYVTKMYLVIDRHTLSAEILVTVHDGGHLHEVGEVNARGEHFPRGAEDNDPGLRILVNPTEHFT